MTAPKRRTPRQWWHSLDAEQKARVYLRVIAVCTGIAVGALLFVLGLLIGGMTPTPPRSRTRTIRLALCVAPPTR